MRFCIHKTPFDSLHFSNIYIYFFFSFACDAANHLTSSGADALRRGACQRHPSTITNSTPPTSPTSTSNPISHAQSSRAAHTHINAAMPPRKSDVSLVDADTTTMTDAGAADADTSRLTTKDAVAIEVRFFGPRFARVGCIDLSSLLGLASLDGECIEMSPRLARAHAPILTKPACRTSTFPSPS